MLTFGSLFAGIGGVDRGFEKAGMSCAWQVEIDQYCISDLKKQWPDVPKYEDITIVTGKELGYVDVIVGGFPCQDLSLAGKGAGLDGERSGLWWEMLRIINEIRPRIVVVENVPGLIVRGFGRFLGSLAESGYDCEYDCVPAAAVGAPHRRDRVFIISRRRF